MVVASQGAITRYRRGSISQDGTVKTLVSEVARGKVAILCQAKLGFLHFADVLRQRAAG